MVLYQEQEDGTCRLVDCASRFLTDTEKHYYPIEIEMLAVTWGIKRMSMYLQGLPEFTVCTDHKPLVPILNYKPLVEMSPRIQGLRMKLLEYNFKAMYVPEKELLDADTLSRAPVGIPTKDDELANKDLAVYVNAIMSQLPMSNKRLEEIKEETEKDEVLQKVIKAVKLGWPFSKRECDVVVKPYWGYMDSLTYLQGILLNGDRIVVPKTMRKEVLRKIHEGHLGINKSKSRARQCVCWPGMGQDIEKVIEKCETCAKLQASKPKEPMLIGETPTLPWKKV